MNRQEAEQLAEHIRTEAPRPIAVVGIEPLGPGNPAYITEFAVECACKITGRSFLVKSFEHWVYLHTGDALVRFCKIAYQLIKR